MNLNKQENHLTEICKKESIKKETFKTDLTIQELCYTELYNSDCNANEYILTESDLTSFCLKMNLIRVIE